jgi:hypothetical protein
MKCRKSKRIQFCLKGIRLYLGRPNPEKQREYHLQNNPPELIKSTSRQNNERIGYCM